MAWHTRLLTSPYLPIVTSGWLPTASKRCVWLTFALSSVDSWDTLSPTEFVFTVHKVLLQSNSLAPCKVIHIPESRKFRILGFGIRNLAQGVRNRISADKNSVIRNPQRRIPNLTLSQITLRTYELTGRDDSRSKLSWTVWNGSCNFQIKHHSWPQVTKCTRVHKNFYNYYIYG